MDRDQKETYYEVIDTKSLPDPFICNWNFGDRMYRQVHSIRVSGAYVPFFKDQKCVLLNLPSYQKVWPIPTHTKEHPCFSKSKFSDMIYTFNPPINSLRDVAFYISDITGTQLTVSDIVMGDPHICLVIEIICKDFIYAPNA
jgi:hypothetical protein